MISSSIVIVLEIFLLLNIVSARLFHTDKAADVCYSSDRLFKTDVEYLTIRGQRAIKAKILEHSSAKKGKERSLRNSIIFRRKLARTASRIDVSPLKVITELRG